MKKLKVSNFTNMAKQRNINTISSDDISFKDRVSALKNLPALFRLVWQSSPQKTTFSFLLRILRSAMPVTLLYVGKLIIDEVVHLTHQGAGGDQQLLWELVALEFGLAVITDALNRLINLLDSLLGDLFSNHTSMQIMRHAATLDLEQFEDSVFYDKLERARQQTVGRSILLSQVMSQVQDFISMGFLVTGLFAFNPWLILLLLAAIIPSFLGESYFNSKNYALTRSQTPERRELDYLRYLGASDATAKEVKIFGLSDFITSRFRTLSGKFYKDNSKLAVRRSAWAYMKDAQVLILDEPTAALDARAEYEVFQRFAELTKGKSAVLISHRFSTARLADRILVLDNGMILESGTHNELLKRERRYAELFKLQAKGYQ
jgi:ATP-binding cassette subfamily B protein